MNRLSAKPRAQNAPLSGSALENDREWLEIQDIPVEVRRNSRRRSRIAIVIDSGGYVVLDVPPATGESEIKTLVNEHRHWLRRRLDQVQAEPGLSTRLTPEAGSLIPYQGQRFTLQPRIGKYRPAELTSDSLYLGVAAEEPGKIKRALQDWYRRQAAEVFYEALLEWKHLPWLNQTLPSWRHRYMRSQWGSCRPDGHISLNTHLIKVPPSLLRMVVLHELCHLQYHHHGVRFYGLMDRHLPEHRELSKELDAYNPVLLHEC